MLWFVSHWRVFAVIAGLLAGACLYALGRHDGKQQAAYDWALATAKQIQKRAEIDEDIYGLDSVGLCLELGGLQSDCEQLRRVESDPR